MKYPFLISLPHCSSKIPDSVKSDLALDENGILKSKDFGTQEIFESLPAHIVKAQYSRFLVDLNRNPANRGDKGIVAKTDYNGQQIYKPGKYPDHETMKLLIGKYFTPYHERVENIFSNPDIRFLFDCHSLNGTGPQDAPDAGKKRKDIILSNNGDHNGNHDNVRGPLSCPEEILMYLKSLLENHGFSVSINDPYRGGFITVFYGQKYHHKHALQIEVNQDLYMESGRMICNPGSIKTIRLKFADIFKELAGYFF